MISSRLYGLVRCPDCGGEVGPAGGGARCTSCGRAFATAEGYLDLRPAAAFDENTKYLDAALHADARHASIAPPLLGSRVRYNMLRRFLQLGPDDRAIDLGCGSGRALAWTADAGAASVGVDISPFFAREALDGHDLILGDLRRLPMRDGMFTRAWTLDVVEHVSPDALRQVLAEANRVLAPDGALFIYSHVRKNGPIALGVRAVNRLAAGLERLGLLDLRQERLRKSDHLNPIADHDELKRFAAQAGFRIERITYYTPIIGAFVENILARMAERWLTTRAGRKTGAAADEGAAMRAARASAKARVRQRGPTYRLLLVLSSVMMLDVYLFGRLKSGPFFALLRKIDRRA